MNFKPDEGLLMSYLYDELQADEKAKVEEYLASNPKAVKELEQLKFLRTMLNRVEDKEVIAPPFVFDEPKHRYLWNTTYFKVITSIAASLIIVILVGKLSGLQVTSSGNEVRISFGAPVDRQAPPQLSSQEVQHMIDESLAANNQVIQASLEESREQYQASVKEILAGSSLKTNELVRLASKASEDQVRQYVLTMRDENTRLMKDYMELTANEQKQYVEDLLVDFAKYMQQQRTNDLMTLQTRLTSIEQTTNQFQLETEQILTSIITSVDKDATTGTKY